MSFRRIVAGVDGGPSGRDALAFGASLADACGATLVVAHIIEEDHPWSEFDRDYQRDLRLRLGDFRKDTSPVFERLGTERGEFTAIPAHNAPEGLGMAAEKSGADLLVVGSTHWGPIGRVLVGTTGTRLLRGASCSLAVAPRGFADSAPERRGAVGVGIDGSASSHTAMSVAARLADRLGGRVLAIGVASTESAQSRIEEALGQKEALEAEHVVAFGDPATELAAQAAELDLLVVGSRAGSPMGHIRGGSVSRRLMRLSPVPVLVAPERISADKAIA